MEEMMKESKEISDGEVESACECLMRAEEIKANPELMKKCREKMSGKMKAMKSISDLKAKAEEMDMEDEDED